MNKKQLSILLVIVIFGCGVFFAWRHSQKVSVESQEYATYNNPNIPFTFQYPVQTSSSDQQVRDISDLGNGEKGVVVDVGDTEPQNGYGSLFQIFLVQVDAHELANLYGSPITAANFVEALKKKIIKERGYNPADFVEGAHYDPIVFTDTSLLPVKLGALPGFQFHYTVTPVNGDKFFDMNYAAFVGGKVYLATFEERGPSPSAETLSKVQRIFDTFALK